MALPTQGSKIRHGRTRTVTVSRATWSVRVWMQQPSAGYRPTAAHGEKAPGKKKRWRHAARIGMHNSHWSGASKSNRACSINPSYLTCTAATWYQLQSHEQDNERTTTVTWLWSYSLLGVDRAPSWQSCLGIDKMVLPRTSKTQCVAMLQDKHHTQQN